MNMFTISTLIVFVAIAILIVVVKRIVKQRIDHNKPLPKPAFFIMRNVLKFRRNPEKYKHILQQAGVKEGMTILDYGCGIGSYTIEAAKLAGKSGKVVAADVNEKMLEEVQKNVEANKLSNIQPLLINAPEDVETNNFDVIFLIDVLHLMQNPVQTIELMRKKLTDTGKLLIKPDHFGKQQSQELLSMLTCSDKLQINDKYWLLNK